MYKNISKFLMYFIITKGSLSFILCLCKTSSPDKTETAKIRHSKISKKKKKKKKKN